MVVNRDANVDPAALDLGYLAFFLGLRINEMVAEQMTNAGFRDVRQSHGYVVQHLISQDRTITELAGRMGVSQQAASKTVAEMIGLGIIETVPCADRRARKLRLSERGWQAVRLGRKIRRGLDARLQRRLGPERYAEVHALLLEALSSLGPLDWIATRRVRAPR